jgi:hypothetical protein
MAGMLDVQAAGRSCHQSEDACPVNAAGDVRTPRCLCVTLAAPVQQEPHGSANEVSGPRKCGCGIWGAR